MRTISASRMPSLAASLGWISAKGSARCCERRGLLAVRVIVCQWSRTRPVLRTSGKFACRRASRARGGSRDEAALAVRRVEAPVGEEARLVRRALALARGHWTGASASKSAPHRYRRRRRGRNRARRRSQRPTARHVRRKLRGRLDKRRRRQSPCGGATSAMIAQSGRASPGAAGSAAGARCAARNW